MTSFTDGYKYVKNKRLRLFIGFLIGFMGIVGMIALMMLAMGGVI